ncbi:MAG: DUF192 domain-containing protein [Bacteriovoracaceae bacterium]|nr:DUF192 domain-containing protein [Bacteriovoracaceae bacterium]
MKLINKTKNKTVLEKMKVADTFYTRLMGLMFVKHMDNYDGVLFKRSNAIHTFFMKFSLDVIFLNHKYQVVKVIKDMKPNRMTRMYFTAAHVIEVEAGKYVDAFSEGDALEVINV